MSESYYGRPIVKPHVWKAYVPAYFWIGGMAGAAAVQSVAARARGEDGLATVHQRAALAGVLVAPVLLIADLGVPARFINMLRVFKPTSPMNVGSWILTAFGGAVVTATAADVLGMRRSARALELVAAALGPALTVYTAVLISDTATPVWHGAYRELPFVFAASGFGSAGAIGAAFAPAAERAFATRTMVAGAFALPLAGHVMERRLGKLLAEPYRVGRAGALRRASGVLSIGGALIALAGRGNATATRLAAGCVVAAGLIERFAVSAAGTQSALDPKYVVQPQRATAAAAER